jgi:hypothetical protein
MIFINAGAAKAVVAASVGNGFPYTVVDISAVTSAYFWLLLGSLLLLMVLLMLAIPSCVAVSAAVAV